MATKVYIAAPYPIREIAIGMMDMLEGCGFEVTSTWLKAPDEMADEFARLDLRDVARADVLFALNPRDWTSSGTGGRHVELGYALALDKAIVLYGERSNIFHHLDHVRLVVDPRDVSDAIYRAVEERQRAPIVRDNAVARVLAEFSRAEAKHKPMNSPHEGYAVILEELDELWADIKADSGREQVALREAVQVAAMGLRYVRDLSPTTVSQNVEVA